MTFPLSLGKANSRRLSCRCIAFSPQSPPFVIPFASPPMKRPCHYPAAEIEDSDKSKIARLYLIQGKSKKEFTAECSEAGFAFSERQLSRWVTLVQSGMEAISSAKRAGSLPALTRSQRDISSGWVLSKLALKEPVRLDAFVAFVHGQFSISLSKMTASNYLREDGFAYCKLTRSFVVDKVSAAPKKAWLRAYRISQGEDARGNRPNIPEELHDRLDGLYWEKKK